MMNIDLQPVLENDLIRIIPLKNEDFERLYAVASDPLIWVQHPNHDRYKREVFEIFFQEAMESKGAFIIYDRQTGNVIGSSRYYEFDADQKTIVIGYTFIGRNFWGKGYNAMIKKLMLQHAFQFADQVRLHIGVTNFRSQKAAEKLGFQKLADQENVKPSYTYAMHQDQWKSGLLIN